MSVRSSSDSPMCAFYSSQNVLLTGGTGFLGKVLIEKLLRCTDVSTLYIVVREKRGKSIHTRLDELLADPVFDRVRREKPKFGHRVVAIAGDCAQAGLGLNQADRELLLGAVNVIFHVAATVRFDEELRLAYAINIRSTGDVLDLAAQMRHLKSMVHVSTAFSHCHLERIEERFYECPDPEALEGVLEKLSAAETAAITPKLLGKWPNTYTFTKALAESLVQKRGRSIPVGVFRPAIVTSTYQEPVPGWTDNMYGPTGICTGALTGVLRCLHCDVSKVADIVPVDTCIAGLLVAAKDVAERHERKEEEIPIYNYVSSAENPLRWAHFMLLNSSEGRAKPPASAIWSVNFRATSNYWVYIVYRFLLHTVPALIMDLLLMLAGRKARFLTLYSRVHKMSDVLLYFCLREWKFSNGNVQRLWGSLNERDQRLFPLSMTTVHWLAYLQNYISGIRQYLIRESPGSLPVARAKQRRFLIAENVIKFAVVFTISCVIWTLFRRLVYTC